MLHLDSVNLYAKVNKSNQMNVIVNVIIVAFTLGMSMSRVRVR